MNVYAALGGCMCIPWELLQADTQDPHPLCRVLMSLLHHSRHPLPGLRRRCATRARLDTRPPISPRAVGVHARASTWVFTCACAQSKMECTVRVILRGQRGQPNLLGPLALHVECMALPAQEQGAFHAWMPCQMGAEAIAQSQVSVSEC